MKPKWVGVLAFWGSQRTHFGAASSLTNLAGFSLCSCSLSSLPLFLPLHSSLPLFLISHSLPAPMLWVMEGGMQWGSA